MGDSILRKYIKEVLNGFANGAYIYSNGPNKFPYMDGTDATTPSDLAAEADYEFGSPTDEIEESTEEVDLDSYYIKVPTFDGTKKGLEPYKITNKHWYFTFLYYYLCI